MKLWLRDFDPTLYSFCVSDLWAAWLMLLGGCLVYALTLRLTRPEDRGMMLRLVVLALVLRCGWAWAQHRAIPQILVSGFAVDTLVNHKYCSAQAHRWRDEGTPPELPHSLGELHTRAVRLKTTVLYYIFGDSPLVAEAVTITAGASVVLAVYLLALQMGYGGKAGRAAAALVACFPSLVWYSTQDLRDPVETCAVTWSFVGLVGLLRGTRRAGSLALLLAMDALSVAYRPYLGLLLLGGQVVAASMAFRLGHGGFPRALKVVLIALGLVVGADVSVRELVALYDWQGASLDALVLAQSIRDQAMQQAGSAYFLKVQPHGLLDAMVKLPVLVLLLVLTPLPFLPGSAAMLATYPEMWFLYLYVLPNLVRGLRAGLRTDRVRVAIILAGIAPMVAAYAVRIVAAGVAIRLRTQFLPLFFVFAGLGADLHAKRRLARPTLAKQYLQPRMVGKSEDLA